MDITPYNPLDKENLGRSVAGAMLNSTVFPLSGLEPFYGAGIYAIYYTGDFAPYELLAEQNRENRFAAPMYVGKAVSPGSRKGDAPSGTRRALYKRLRDHARSIDSATNLEISDFFCRFLVVDDFWVSLSESLLITQFSPVWNKLVEGFGNHHQGATRCAGTRSKWDTLHPGRQWASKYVDRPEMAEQIIEEIEDYLKVSMPQKRVYENGQDQ